MNDPAAIDEILKVYKKHGWTLRRVLLSQKANPERGDAAGDIFSGAEIVGSDIDAMWFTRPSQPGNEAWELRALTATPFALLEVIPDDTAEAGREQILQKVEERMSEMLVRGRAKNN